MAVFIDVITGFLESGKTTFIQEIIQSETLKEYVKTLLIVCEEGIHSYDREDLKKQNIYMLNLEEYEELSEQLFITVMEDFDPDYIIMEYNGTWDITGLLSLKLPRYYKFRNIIHISEAGKFKHYLSNMAAIIQPQILNSDMVLFNRFDNLNRKEKKQLCGGVKNINPRTEVFFHRDLVQNKLKNYFVPYEKYQKVTPGMIILAVILLILCIIPFSVLEDMYDKMQSVSTVFLSILMQALPFILLGAFVSSAIQIMIPAGWIMSKFSKHNYSSFFFAAIAGFFMPICDCGLVPIVSGLLRKDTPLPQTITFWLTSAAVNPIVILSVIYAFPDRPWLAVLRILAGAAIGILVGLLLKVSNIQTKDVINKNRAYSAIGANMLELKYEGAAGKLTSVLDVAKTEFFRVTKYVIFGALVSSLFQSVMPDTLKSFIGGSILIQMLIMTVAAIFMSTCSTSNAFIGRSFYRDFAIVPVMSFIVMGPMLDFKNLIMLSEVLKKSFLVKLAVLVMVTGFFIFSVIHFSFSLNI